MLKGISDVLGRRSILLRGVEYMTFPSGDVICDQSGRPMSPLGGDRPLSCLDWSGPAPLVIIICSFWVGLMRSLAAATTVAVPGHVTLGGGGGGGAAAPMETLFDKSKAAASASKA